MGGTLAKEKNGIQKNKSRCPKSDRKIAAVESTETLWARIEIDFRLHPSRP